VLEIDESGFPVSMHAYGKAADTPAHLRALLDGDVAARRKALNHLNSAVLHQGTPWPVTASAALVIGQILRDASIAGPETAWLRRELLRWLAEFGDVAATPYQGDLVADADPPGRDVRSEIARIVADCTDEDGPWDHVVADRQRERAMWAQIMLDCRQAAAHLIDVAVAGLTDPDAEVRASAADAAAMLTRATGLDQ
jgi:HEAT repeat protein